jgi:ferrous iron transport protein B
MQCLHTLAVTRRETGGWKWAVIQLSWMTGIAYGAALLVHSGLRLTGVA